MAETRHCVGSTRFAIEAHDAPIDAFSAQPSQKDGLSRMCATHWKTYVAGLAREAKERTAATATSGPAGDDAPPPEPVTKRARTRPTMATETPVAQEGADG
jgi:hypothetical protein